MKKIIITLFLVLFGILVLSSCEKECVHSWKLATCDTPRLCSVCGETDGEPKGHAWKEATCEAPKTCKSCGLLEGRALGHTWSSYKCEDLRQCETCGTRKDPEGHQWNTDVCLETPFCEKCGVEDDPIDHDWVSADCTTPKYCQKCGVEGGIPIGHKWQITTCKEPKVCTVCSATSTQDLPHTYQFRGCDEQRICTVCFRGEGKPYGHTWEAATCSSPKICAKCYITEGEKLEHIWHEATCASAKRCELCGSTEGRPLDHKYTQTGYIEPVCGDGKKILTCSGCSGIVEISIPATIGYHICDEYGDCINCDNVFESKDLTLIEVQLANKYSVERCGLFECSYTTSKIYKPITYEDIGMPVIELTGVLPTSKNNYANTVEFIYTSEGISFTCYAQLNVQGASSAGKPKKNFNIKLVDESGSKNKVKIVEEWGKESKYCLKANYIDYSQSRNVVSGQIFGEIVKSRNDELVNTPNGGAIDGYPVLIYNNGEYQGLYTFNIPKDNWMFDMSHSDEKNQAILMTTTWNKAVSFRELSTSGFELEFASNEDSLIDNNTQWVYDSMLDLIRFTLNSSNEEFKNGIHEYADIEKCIDSMIYTFFICADDNTSKNILWATLDGKVWFSSMYDMDGTWGMRWNGNIEFNEYTHPITALVDGVGLAPERNHERMNLLWERIYINFFDQVCERYKELRQEILTMENITVHFTAFFDSIPDLVREAEKKKWTGVPTQNRDHLEQILTFAEKRLAVYDEMLMPKDTQTQKKAQKCAFFVAIASLVC